MDEQAETVNTQEDAAAASVGKEAGGGKSVWLTLLFLLGVGFMLRVCRHKILSHWNTHRICTIAKKELARLA